MFTVVAVDAKLEPLLKDYLPLYETAREEQIRMIRWNRQGGSVQTALPQLEEQVQEQNEWRILLVGDEDVIRTRNPFDIARSDQAADYARCAQMLGHIPPWITFHEEEGGLSSQIDMPQEQEREERRFTDPDQIFLLAVTQERQDIKKMRSIRNEDAVDPEFWNRCNYPANCRFLKMNLLRKHNIVTPGARMELSMGIHTLAFNEIPSSDLQAYELYNLIIELNEEAEYAGFSEYYSRLQAVELRLQRARETIGEECPDVAADFEDELEGMRVAIDSVKAEADSLYAGRLLTEAYEVDYTGNYSRIQKIIKAAREAQEAAGVAPVRAEGQREVRRVYSLSGELLDAPRRGAVNVVEYSDGTVRKVKF